MRARLLPSPAFLVNTPIPGIISALWPFSSASRTRPIASSSDTLWMAWFESKLSISSFKGGIHSGKVLRTSLRAMVLVCRKVSSLSASDTTASTSNRFTTASDSFKKSSIRAFSESISATTEMMPVSTNWDSNFLNSSLAQSCPLIKRR